MSQVRINGGKVLHATDSIELQIDALLLMYFIDPFKCCAQWLSAEREIQTCLELMTGRVPKVWARTGEVVTSRSALVPPYVRSLGSLSPQL